MVAQLRPFSWRDQVTVLTTRTHRLKFGAVLNTVTRSAEDKAELILTYLIEKGFILRD